MGRKRIAKADVLTVNELLSNYIFTIPEYQRSYSWGKDQLRDLFSDILADIEKNETMFMSTIVTLYRKKEIIGNDYKLVDLVDGQQRITTIVLLLKAILKAKEDLGFSDSEIDDLLVKKDAKKTRDVLSQGKHKSSTMLSNFLKNATIGSIAITTHAQKNLETAIDQCNRFINYSDYLESSPKEKRDVSTIDRIKDILLNKYQLVNYEIPEEKEVYKTFESLNSRGLPVAAIDEFKCKLMGIAYAENDDQTVSELHNIWARIYDVIGIEKIKEDEILSISGTLYKALDDNKMRPKTVSDAMDYFSSVALKNIGESSVPPILKHDNPSLDTRGFRCQKISELIELMAKEMVKIHKDKSLDALTDVKHARVLLFAIELSDYSEEEKNCLLDVWEKTTFRLFSLHRKDARSFIREYTDCAMQVISKENINDVKKSIKSIGSTYTFEDGLDKIKGSDWYPAYNNDVIYIMRKYDEYLAKQANATIAASVWKVVWEHDPATTIEHIFPKTYPKNSADEKQFDRDWAHGGKRFNQKKLDGFVNNIGNLTILEPNVNSKAGQMPYDKKIELYGSAMRIHPASDSPYLKKGYWTEQSIKERETEILNFIKQTWK